MRQVMSCSLEMVSMTMSMRRRYIYIHCNLCLYRWLEARIIFFAGLNGAGGFSYLYSLHVDCRIKC